MTTKAEAKEPKAEIQKKEKPTTCGCLDKVLNFHTTAVEKETEDQELEVRPYSSFANVEVEMDTINDCAIEEVVIPVITKFKKKGATKFSTIKKNTRIKYCPLCGQKL